MTEFDYQFGFSSTRETKDCLISSARTLATKSPQDKIDLN